MKKLRLFFVLFIKILFPKKPNKKQIKVLNETNINSGTTTG